MDSTEPFFEDLTAIAERRWCYLARTRPMRRSWGLILLWICLLFIYCVVTLLDVSEPTISDKLLDWAAGIYAGYLIANAYQTFIPVTKSRVRPLRR